MRWKWWFVAIVLLLLNYRLSISYHLNYPDCFEIKDFPLISQPDNVTCGPTSVAMVLKYYGISASVDDVAKVAKTRLYKSDTTTIGVTTPEYIAVALKQYKVSCHIEREVSVERLKECVCHAPVIALVRSGTTTWHYVVVIGYDEANIIIADPGNGRRHSLLTENFIGAWRFINDLDGEKTVSQCPICSGTGRIFRWGPFGVCDACGGTGMMPDWMWLLVEMGEAKSCTIIVPKPPR